MSKDYLPDFRLVKLVCQPSPLNMGWSRIAEQIKKGSRLWEPDFYWWRIPESNRGPADYDSVALTG